MTAKERWISLKLWEEEKKYKSFFEEIGVTVTVSEISKKQDKEEIVNDEK